MFVIGGVIVSPATNLLTITNRQRCCWIAVSLVLASYATVHTLAQDASDPFAMVQQLGQFPASIDGRIQSNTGQMMPVEQRRDALFVKLRALGEAAVPALQRGLVDPDVQLRRNVALYLESEGGNYAGHAPAPLDLKPFLPQLLTALRDDDQRVKELTAQAVSHLGPDGAPAIPALLKQLEDPSAGLKNTACIGLAGIGPAAREALPALRSTVADPGIGDKRLCTRAIALIDR